MAEPQNRKTVEEELNRETAARGFVEYPKMLHHTDGSNCVVNNKKEEAEKLRSGEDHPTPQEAIDEKATRDEADAKRAAEKVAAEAKAKREADAALAAEAAKAAAAAGAGK